MFLRQLLCLWVTASFLFSLIIPPQIVYAQAVLNLPAAGSMVSVSPSFQPPLIKGLTVHQDNPFLFDFIVDPGQDYRGVIARSAAQRQSLKDQADRMIKYFFAALTIPDKDIWVNLSPYEKDRMVPMSLGQTAMGRGLLAQDYMLKQLTASLIYPQQALGKVFWQSVYTKAKEQYGTTEVPVNTFNKVWIVPQKAGIYEHGQTAFIVSGHLKVMLEEDYLALNKQTNKQTNLSLSLNSLIDHKNFSPQTTSTTHAVTSQLVRSLILPEIEKEVNDGKNFATLRQIFYAQVLAVWFKRNLKQALLNRIYANKSTVKGIDDNTAAVNEAIYQQYLKAYKKGVFNFIKEDIDPVTQETMPRKYFSGGYASGAMTVDILTTPTPVVVKAEENIEKNGPIDFAVLAANHAMISKIGGIAALTMTGLLANSDALANPTPPPTAAVSQIADTKLEPINEQQIRLYAAGIQHTIHALGNPQTGIPPSHNGHPGYENLTFMYDNAYAAIALKATGDQAGAERLLDYVFNPLRLAKIKLANGTLNGLVDTNGTWGIVKVYKGHLGLVNAFNRSSTKPQGEGQLEFVTTPGPMAWIIFAALNVNPDKYLADAVTLGETLLAMQREDGGIVNGDADPNKVHFEPHVDAFTAFLQLYEHIRDQKLKQAADKAWAFFNKHRRPGHIPQGLWGTSLSEIHATDVYSWTDAGPVGQKDSLDVLAQDIDTMLKSSLVRVTFPVPDGSTRTAVLVNRTVVSSDFTNPTAQEASNLRRGMIHAIGSSEWLGGVILDLKVASLRFWKAGKAQEAKFYKSLAEILTNEWAKTAYIVDGKLQFPYATSMNTETGHGWRTPVTLAVDAQGKIVIAGGSIVGGWGILPALNKNPFLDPLHIDSLGAYASISMDNESLKTARGYITKIISEPGRSYTEPVNHDVPDAKRSIVEPRTYNANMWQAFNERNYRQVSYWADQILNERAWVELAQRDQKTKKAEVGGLVQFRWGISPEAQPEAEAKIWRYPLLNEVAVAIWAKATASLETGNRDEAKRWIREMIEKYAYHQIYAPAGPGYWNALVSWELNPGNNARDAKMGVLYREVLKEMGLSTAVPREIPVGRIGSQVSTPEQGNEGPSLERKLPSPTVSQEPGPSVVVPSTGATPHIGARDTIPFNAETSSNLTTGEAQISSSYSPAVRLLKGRKLKVTYNSDTNMKVAVQLFVAGKAALHSSVEIKSGDKQTVSIEIPKAIDMEKIVFNYGSDVGGNPLSLFEILSLQTGSGLTGVSPEAASPIKPSAPKNVQGKPVEMQVWSGGDGQSFYTDFRPASTVKTWTIRFNWSGLKGKILVRLLRSGQSPGQRGSAREINVTPGANTVTLEANGPVSQLSFHTGNAWGDDYARGEVSDVAVPDQAMTSIVRHLMIGVLMTGIGVYAPSVSAQDKPIEMQVWSGGNGQSFYTDFRPPSTEKTWKIKFKWDGPTGKILIRLLKPGQSPDLKGKAKEMVVRQGNNTVTLEASDPVRQLSFHTGNAWGVNYARGEVSDVTLSKQEGRETASTPEAASPGKPSAAKNVQGKPVEMQVWSGGDGQSFYTDFRPASTVKTWTIRFNWSGPKGKILVRLLSSNQSPDQRGSAREINVNPGVNKVTLEATSPVKQLSFHTGNAWGDDYARGEVSDVVVDKAMVQEQFKNQVKRPSGLDEVMSNQEKLSEALQRSKAIKEKAEKLDTLNAAKTAKGRLKKLLQEVKDVPHAPLELDEKWQDAVLVIEADQIFVDELMKKRQGSPKKKSSPVWKAAALVAVGAVLGGSGFILGQRQERNQAIQEASKAGIQVQVVTEPMKTEPSAEVVPTVETAQTAPQQLTMQSWSGGESLSFYHVFSPAAKPGKYSVTFTWSGSAGEIYVRMLRVGASPDSPTDIQAVNVKSGVNRIQFDVDYRVQQVSFHTGDAWGRSVASGSVSNVSIGGFNDRAMLHAKKTTTVPDKAALAVNGGIDLSQQDAAMRIEKDANGGVKVNVDPAMIARVEREGLSEVVPVIINMRPADIQSLFGVAV